ncbi:gliding motility-associated C-terminal domain-containing protein [Flavobacterium bernardetii]|uniref:Gliding motility-associated C-terminal domain-containing protein n=1 Tax=Flavobacterium bernardetii TaxID=2813823 RepID=A0ABR7IXL4_9FLAO|nr:gliding motility-associated C-terminal domain-containing protein [Flavobacterium bernardetii]MBC5834521.1 gliding motility-associated C-terminal domain-containing protein [Flavobacterium bernardetii]
MQKIKYLLSLVFTLSISMYVNGQCTDTSIRPGDSFSFTGQTAPSCFNGNNGSFTVFNISSTIGSGNFTNQQYLVRLLSGPPGPSYPVLYPVPLNASTLNIPGLSPGTYTVDIIDQCGGNSADQTVTINNQPAGGFNDSYLNVSDVSGCGATRVYSFLHQVLIPGTVYGNHTYTYTNNIGNTLTNSVNLSGGLSSVFYNIPLSFFNGGSINYTVVNFCGQTDSGTIPLPTLITPDVLFGSQIVNVKSGCLSGYNIRVFRQLISNDVTVSVEETANPGFTANDYLGNPMNPVTLNINHFVNPLGTILPFGLQYGVDYTLRFTDACGQIITKTIRRDITSYNPTINCLSGGIGSIFRGGRINIGISALEDPTGPISVTILSGPPVATTQSGDLGTITSAPIVYPIVCQPLMFDTWLTGNGSLRSVGSPNFHFPEGTYNIQIVDACGKTATRSFTIGASCINTYNPLITTNPCGLVTPAAVNFSISSVSGGISDGGLKWAIYDNSNNIVLTANTLGSIINNTLPNGTYRFRYGGVNSDWSLNESTQWGGIGGLPRLTGGFLYEKTFTLLAIPLSFTSVTSCDTTITSTATGGIAPLQYSLLDATGTITIVPNQATGNFSGLTPGTTYQLKATDACGRELFQLVTVTPRPTIPTISAITQPTCTTTTGSFAITNYNSAFTYTIVPAGATLNTTTGVVTAPPGTYSITPANSGCPSNTPLTGIIINPQPTTLPAPLVGAIVHPTCASVTGSFTITNYDASHTYTITPAGATLNTTTGVVTAPAGNYTVTATLDVCTSPITNTIINAQPPIPTVPVVGIITQTTCITTTGSVVLSGLPSGSWTLTQTGTVNNTISGSGTSTTVSGLIPGTYSFTVNNGFCDSVTATSPITINPQPANVTQVGVTSTTCSGTNYTITVEVSGTAPFTATGTGAPGTWVGNIWTSNSIAQGTNYSISIQDANACNTLVVSGISPVCCIFEVTCPTFPITTVACYAAIPTTTTLTEAQFEALGNVDGLIGNNPCGIIEITASNTADPGCEGNVIRTYTVTEYADPNNNDIRDLGENTVLNIQNCTQTFTIERADFTMPANASSTVACPADVVAPTVPVVTDACGNILTPSAPVVSTSPTCEGNVTYTYTFTDCEGNANNWVYTYTIERANFIMPANASSTVACPADVVAPTVPVVTDACGNTLTPSAPVVSASPTCEGNITYTYTFTDCEGNANNWVYTYTIERANFTMPANASSTVACPADVVAPTVPVVTDACGNTLTPSAPVVSTSPTCEGNVTYTYTFTDCEGNANNWVYTYTIERANFTMPANASSTVACPADVVAPTVPVVTDACGNTLTPSAPVVSTSPTCEGNVTYTYTFTDCEGNANNWVYTYTIERANFTMPVNASSTVACPADVVAPTVPTVTDACGNTLTPSAPIVSTSPTCEGNITYTYTFTDCEGNANNWVYTYTIERNDFTMPVNGSSTVGCITDVVAPIVPTVTDNCGNILTPSAPVVSAPPTCNGTIAYTYTFTDCEGNTHDWVYTYTIDSADFTMPANAASTVACPADVLAPTLPTVTDACGNTLTPSAPVVSALPTCEGTVTYTYTFADCGGNTHDWIYTYSIERANFTMPANAASTVACPADVVAPTIPTVTDACGNTLTPSAPVVSTSPTCEGNVTYTYTFTDCEGNTNNWVYTYTIERANFAMPANAASTVACPADVVAPTVPTVTDACGNILTPGAPVVSTSPTCEGNVTYTYTFTDCEGNTNNWVYTYTIERADFTMPANTASTVACPADVVAPTVPTVTDACGNTLTPSAPVVSALPTCEGNVTYTYTFTDCESNTQDWVYTYTIERADFTMPANAAATVACPADVVAPTVPIVTDACGNTLTPSTPVVSASPTCEGDVTYTYTFTDCEGNTQDWVYTYTIERADFAMPANASSTVACPADVIAPTVPTVTDACGNILTPSVSIVSAMPTCEGDVTYTYTFTDCEGNTHDWVYTYTIDDTIVPTGTAPANLNLQCIANIPAADVNVIVDEADNCVGTVTVTVADTNNGGSGCLGNPYVITRTYTLTDCAGNSTDLIQTITVEDDTNPTFVESLPSNLVLECSDTVPAAVTLTAIDNCSSATVVYNEQRTNGSCVSDYTLTRTWIATDVCGNETTHTQTINVQDTTPPVFIGNLPQDTFVDCDNIPVAPILTASDTCGNATVTLSETEVAGDCTSRYQLIRTWTATDDCGNISVHTQTINLACHIKVWNAVSPNGDTKNDVFYLEGIDCYPNNSVEVYNRWGVKVYETNGYDNVNKVFDGYSDGRTTISRSKLLPTGTYYYILKYEYGFDGINGKQNIEKAGYLYIQNN